MLVKTEAPTDPPTAAMLRTGKGLPAGAIPVRANSLVIGAETVPLDGTPEADAAHEKAGKWSVEFFDDSESGNDKAAAVSAWKPTGTKLIFIGDGVSDLPIATSGGGADAIFAKKGKPLERVCKERGMECVAFESFAEVEAQVRGLLAGWEAEDEAAVSRL